MLAVGLNGKKSSGKDTAGAYLVEKYSFERVSFADKLKQSAAALFGISPSAWDKWKNDPDARVEIRLGHGQHAIVVSLTVREFLQRYGSEAHREIFGADFWVDVALADLDPNGRYVFTDARFENELRAVRLLGGTTWRILRAAAADADDAHESEAVVPRNLIDFEITNDGSYDDLYRVLDDCVYVLLPVALQSEGDSDNNSREEV